jgi:hypothetical protein
VVCKSQVSDDALIPSKVVSLLEIMRAYAEAYVTGTQALTLVEGTIDKMQHEKNDIRNDAPFMNRLQGHLAQLLAHCEHLPMTAIKIKNLLQTIANLEQTSTWTQTELNFMTEISEVLSRLRDELSLNLFFKLPLEKKKHFDHPYTGWEEVIARFGDVIVDIEEMSKCFALSRYAATVFHSVQIIEGGLIHLGMFLKVKDPKSGWTAVAGELDKIVVKTIYNHLPDYQQKCFPFLEQMHAVTIALKSAWRNKISHAQGRLNLMTSDFSPDVTEEIVIASRSFMRRLATEMP